MSATSDNQVIQNGDIDQGQSLDEPLGNENIRVAGLGDAARMIVREDDRSRAPPEDLLDYLTKMDR